MLRVSVQTHTLCPAACLVQVVEGIDICIDNWMARQAGLGDPLLLAGAQHYQPGSVEAITCAVVKPT